MKKINILVLIEGKSIEKYKLEILSEIEKSKFCNIIKIELLPSANKHKAFRYSLYRAFAALDKKFLSGNIKYLEKVSVEEKLTQYTKSSMEPDLVINLTTKAIDDSYGAKYGLWQFIYRSYPIGFWEVINRDPYTKVSLCKTTNNLLESRLLDTLKTMTNDKSVTKNHEQVAWRSHMMVMRNLEKLYEEKEKFYERKDECIAIASDVVENQNIFGFRQKFSDQNYYCPPSNFNAISVYFKFIKKYTKFVIRRVMKIEQNAWIILYDESNQFNVDFSSFKRFYPELENHFVADPFLVDEKEKSYLFYEELNLDDYKGYLKVAEYDFSAGKFKKPETILKEEYHLSWPNVFKLDGKYYMVPESFENKTVDLYEAVDFPLKWKKKKTLLSGIEAVDATFLFKDEKWWMFVNIAEKEDFDLNDELYIFYTDDLINGEWTAHKQNPVISDVTHARPAGNIIEKEGNFYRPSQDCSGIYGRKIVLSKIIQLDETEYKEEIVGELDSHFSEDLEAIHTLNRSKRLTVTDAIQVK